MIISASRRSDIPALYADWFFTRLKEGFVKVANPYNAKQVRVVSLRPEEVEGVVFWTRNSDPMLSRLEQMRGIPFYFQISLTPYGPDLEPGLPDTLTRIGQLLRLADRIGPDRVIWRYDPILFNPDWTPERHENAFGDIAHAVDKAVRHCVFSYVDTYAKIGRAQTKYRITSLTEKEKLDVASRLSACAAAMDLPLFTCAENIDLSPYGIRHGRCVDSSLFEEQNGCLPSMVSKLKRDSGQRPSCLCAPSVDIGMYDTCIHGCVYCYANRNASTSLKRHAAHRVDSQYLTGVPLAE